MSALLINASSLFHKLTSAEVWQILLHQSLPPSLKKVCTESDEKASVAEVTDCLTHEKDPQVENKFQDNDDNDPDTLLQEEIEDQCHFSNITLVYKWIKEYEIKYNTSLVKYQSSKTGPFEIDCSQYQRMYYKCSKNFVEPGKQCSFKICFQYNR